LPVGSNATGKALGQGGTTRCRGGRQSPVEPIDFGGNAPTILAAVQESNAAGLIHFLKSSCCHDFIIQRRKLDVAAQTHTEFYVGRASRRNVAVTAASRRDLKVAQFLTPFCLAIFCNTGSVQLE